MLVDKFQEFMNGKGDIDINKNIVSRANHFKEETELRKKKRVEGGFKYYSRRLG